MALKNLHTTHIHTLSSSVFHCTHTHTHTHTHHVQTPLQGFVGQCISSSVQIKEREARLRGKHSVPLDRIIYNVELFSYMVLKNVHRISYMTAQNKMKVTVWRIDLRFNSLSLHKKIPFESRKRQINKITVDEKMDQNKEKINGRPEWSFDLWFAFGKQSVYF